MPTTPPFLITGLVYDDGVTNNQAAIYRQIAQAIAAGYGEALIPPDPSGGYVGTTDVVLGSVVLEAQAGALSNPSGGGYLTIDVGSTANTTLINGLLSQTIYVVDLTAPTNISSGTTVVSSSGSGTTVTVSLPVNARTTTDTIVFSLTPVPVPTGQSFGLVGLGEGLREAPGAICPPLGGFAGTAIGPCSATTVESNIAPIVLQGGSYVVRRRSCRSSTSADNASAKSAR